MQLAATCIVSVIKTAVNSVLNMGILSPRFQLKFVAKLISEFYEKFDF
jgi:hypothetical protein